jgi:GntR family transcriptional regulator / MocR family aminotransferase
MTLGAIAVQLRSNAVAGTQTNLAWEALLDPSAARPGPLHARLTAAIRAAIRDGRLPLGAALPPSRTLATDLGVSRWTVTQAYGQLVTEGYLTGRTGSATRVCWSPAPDDDRVPHRPGRPEAAPPRPVRFDLSQCQPDFRAFPRHKWVEAIRTAAETAQFDQLGYAGAGGEPQLRAVLAEHLNRRRGAAAAPGTISIFSGAGQSMSQLSRALFEAGHTHIGMEDPGSPRFWPAARTAGLELVPLPVDDDGLVVDALDAHAGLRAVCVGPAHQVATGCVLAPHRRTALLNWARRVDGLVVEDDYDSEFSYDGPALPVMQGTDPDRVALLGSMSRTLTPTVNIGWVVAPGRWVQAIRTDPKIPLMPPALTQLALAHFIESGAYDRYLRASRQRFRARRAALLAALARVLPECRVRGAEAGLHLLLELPAGSDVAAIIAEAALHGIRLCDMDELRLRPEPGASRLMVGYGNLNDAVVDQAIAVLAEIIRRS